MKTLGGEPSVVCAGLGTPADYVWSIYDGDVDFIRVKGQWFKIHTGSVNLISDNQCDYRLYNSCYKNIGFFGGVTSPVGSFMQNLYYILHRKDTATASLYVDKIRRLVFRSLPK